VERSRTSFVTRQRLRDEWPMYSRYRWNPNFEGFAHLVDVGVIPMDKDILDELVAEAMEEGYNNEFNTAEPPQLRLVSDEPAQSSD